MHFDVFMKFSFFRFIIESLNKGENDILFSICEDSRRFLKYLFFYSFVFFIFTISSFILNFLCIIILLEK